MKSLILFGLKIVEQAMVLGCICVVPSFPAGTSNVRDYWPSKRTHAFPCWCWAVATRLKSRSSVAIEAMARF